TLVRPHVKARDEHIGGGVRRAVSVPLRDSLRGGAIDFSSCSRDDEDACTLTRERQSDCATDAATAARHESCPVSKPHPNKFKVQRSKFKVQKFKVKSSSFSLFAFGGDNLKVEL